MGEPSGWQIASISVAEARERYTMAAFGNAWAAMLVELAAPAEGERVLDVACGTGVVARYVAPLVGPTGSVVGLDLNAEMLTLARAMPQQEGVPMVWREGNATALPFPAASFDLVCCQQGVQYFPDRPAALQEMHRVLVPGGRLALGVWRGLAHQPFYAVLAEALERYGGPETAMSLRAAFRLAEADALRTLVAGAGFHAVRVRIQSRLTRHPSLAEFTLGYLAGTPMAGAVAALDTTTRTALVAHVCTALRAYVDDEGMAIPWEAHLVTAQA
ncbi:MAG: class I SAM-dependent methyltransferase [Candidatus Tectimicrobiota bacterium]